VEIGLQIKHSENIRKETTMQQPQYAQPQQPQYYAQAPSSGLGVGDGFKFGCGFFIAGAITMIVLWIVLFIAMLLLGGVIGGILQQISREMSLILPAFMLL
jgi:TM2 domain-containing membrane protein YozV